MATLTDSIMIIHWLWGDPIFSGRPKWMFLKMGGSPNHSFQYVSIRNCLIWDGLGHLPFYHHSVSLNLLVYHILP